MSRTLLFLRDHKIENMEQLNQLVRQQTAKRDAQELLIAQQNIASLYDAERKAEEQNAHPSQSDDR